MTSIILTLSQARHLQREPEENWPGKWKPILDVCSSLGKDTKETPERLQAGMLMVECGCVEEHIREQLNWRPLPMKRLMKLVIEKHMEASR